MPESLSKVERRILDFLVEYLKEHTYQPSIREIGRRFGIKSTKTVSEHLQSLADKGYIEREASRSRGVKIFNLDLGGRKAVTVPYYGRIAAGEPALLRDNVQDEFALDERFVEGESFFMRVRGDSMDQMGILDGDLVLVEPTKEPHIRDGEVVAARLGGEGVVKRYFERDGQVILEPANAEHEPMLVQDYGDFMVLGRVSGLFRRFKPDYSAAVEA